MRLINYGLYKLYINLTHSSAMKFLLSMYGIWNMDFFRPFYNKLCLGTEILPTLALDYVIALYPLLIVITYFLIRLYNNKYRIVVYT